jgi:acyl dehydratase
MRATRSTGRTSPSRRSIRLFCDASLDYNPLHLDDDYRRAFRQD